MASGAASVTASSKGGTGWGVSVQAHRISMAAVMENGFISLFLTYHYSKQSACLPLCFDVEFAKFPVERPAGDAQKLRGLGFIPSAPFERIDDPEPLLFFLRRARCAGRLPPGPLVPRGKLSFLQ
jgi:hypothetical protein